MSLWTPPLKGGFICREFILVWGLAVATARARFDNLFLITDELGAKTMNDFPYDFISTELQRHFVPPNARHVWSAGKLEAFRVMAEKRRGEFCHFDGDVFLRKSPSIFGLPLYAQSDEPFVNPSYHGFDPKRSFFHATYVTSGVPKIPVLPGHARFSLTRDYQRAFNAGIVGGTDIDFIGRWAEEGLWVLNHPTNQRILENIHSGVTSCFVEQYLLASKAAHEGKKVATLYPHVAETNEDFMESIGYVHLLGESKRTVNILEAVEAVLKSQFPWMYEIIETMNVPSNPSLRNSQSYNYRPLPYLQATAYELGPYVVSPQRYGDDKLSP